MKEYRVFVWAWKNHYGRLSVCVNAQSEEEAKNQAVRLACKLSQMEASAFLAIAGETYGE